MELLRNPEVTAAIAALIVAICAAAIRRIEKRSAEALSRRRERARIAEKTGDYDLLDDTQTKVTPHGKGRNANGRR